jgi:hypothetical protein
MKKRKQSTATIKSSDSTALTLSKHIQITGSIVMLGMTITSDTWVEMIVMAEEIRRDIVHLHTFLIS